MHTHGPGTVGIYLLTGQLVFHALLDLTLDQEEEGGGEQTISNDKIGKLPGSMLWKKGKRYWECGFGKAGWPMNWWCQSGPHGEGDL